MSKALHENLTSPSPLPEADPIPQAGGHSFHRAPSFHDSDSEGRRTRSPSRNEGTSYDSTRLGSRRTLTVDDIHSTSGASQSDEHKNKWPTMRQNSRQGGRHRHRGLSYRAGVTVSRVDMRLLP
jgi:hypothetical protein